MRTSPLPRVPVGYPSRQRDLGGGPAEETGGGEAARIQGRTVDGC